MMTTKLAEDLTVGDKVIEDESNIVVQVTRISRGFWPGTVLVDFYPHTGEFGWSCLDWDTEIVLAPVDPTPEQA